MTTRDKCDDGESSYLRNVSASRRGCEAGASREIVKITSEQSGPKERQRPVPVALNGIPPLREGI